MNSFGNPTKVLCEVKELLSSFACFYLDCQVRRQRMEQVRAYGLMTISQEPSSLQPTIL